MIFYCYKNIVNKVVRSNLDDLRFRIEFHLQFNTLYTGKRLNLHTYTVHLCECDSNSSNVVTRAKF